MESHVPHSLVRALRRIPDFAGLDERTLLAIVGESMNLFWRAGSTIFERGSAGDAFYVVLSGDISIRDEEGREVIHPREGDFFGEVSLLLNTTHRRDATAVTDCEILVLPKDAFTSVLESNPWLAEHFETVLHARHPEALAELHGSGARGAASDR